LKSLFFKNISIKLAVIVYFFLMLNSFAEENTKGKIVLQAIYEGIGIQKESTVPAPPSPVTPTPEEEMTPIPTVTPKPLSRGEQVVKDQLEKNRQILAQRRAKEKELAKGNVKKKAQSDSDNDNNDMDSLAKQNEDWIKNTKKENDETLRAWKNEVEKTYAEWKEKRNEFLSNLKTYKKNLYPLQAEKPLSKQELKLSGLTMKLNAEHVVITGALDLPIKDQGKRPTCAAFAGARSIETLLKAKGQGVSVSEQYIYWASKPKCQVSPCSDKGSWTSLFFEKSMKSSTPDIPLTSDCPYNLNPMDDNETQIPLRGNCSQGKLKILSFDYLKNLDETVLALKNNFPVVAGFELTPNFYENNGFVKEADSYKNGKLDNHAAGHALLLVGYVVLPKELQKSEGNLCFIAANSWGEGYGRGGFTCLSEKWVMNHRVPNAFLALKDVSH